MVLKNILVIALLITSSLAYSFVPNDEYYKLADKQISQLSSELKEIKLIKKRVEFYKKLEKSGLIVYSK